MSASRVTVTLPETVTAWGEPLNVVFVRSGVPPRPAEPGRVQPENWSKPPSTDTFAATVAPDGGA